MINNSTPVYLSTWRLHLPGPTLETGKVLSDVARWRAPGHAPCGYAAKQTSKRPGDNVPCKLFIILHSNIHEGKRSSRGLFTSQYTSRRRRRHLLWTLSRYGTYIPLAPSVLAAAQNCGRVFFLPPRQSRFAL